MAGNLNNQMQDAENKSKERFAFSIKISYESILSHASLHYCYITTSAKVVIHILLNKSAKIALLFFVRTH